MASLRWKARLKLKEKLHQIDTVSCGSCGSSLVGCLSAALLSPIHGQPHGLTSLRLASEV